MLGLIEEATLYWISAGRTIVVRSVEARAARLFLEGPDRTPAHGSAALEAND